MSSRMKIGVCLPYMKAGLTREDYLAWFKAIDEGPYHALSCGERVHGPTYDMRVVLAAAAMATDAVPTRPMTEPSLIMADAPNSTFVTS